MSSSSEKEEDSDDYQTQSSQRSQRATQNQSQKTQKRGTGTKRKRKEDDDIELTDDIQEKLVVDLVRYIMCLDSAKLPIKRVDINAKVLSDYKKYANQIFELAAEQIFQIFRMKLVEVETRQRVYILQNYFSPIELDEFINVKTDSQRTEYIILLSVLSLIELSNGRIDLEALLEALYKMGLNKLEHRDRTDLSDKWWENLVKNTFVKQLYLEKEKDPGKGKEITYIVSGYRSKIEIGRLHVNKYISKCFGEEMDEIRAKEIENEIADSEAEFVQSQSSQQTQVQSQSQTIRGRGANNNHNPQNSQVQSQSQDPTPRGRGRGMPSQQQSPQPMRHKNNNQQSSQNSQNLISKKSKRG